jgi:hypothetical protein
MCSLEVRNMILDPVSNTDLSGKAGEQASFNKLQVLYHIESKAFEKIILALPQREADQQVTLLYGVVVQLKAAVNCLASQMQACGLSGS